MKMKNKIKYVRKNVEVKMKGNNPKDADRTSDIYI
jgi:hypothetical protein